MSEALPGVPPAPPPAAPRDAAGVLLYRHGARGPEVFWIKREKTLRFAGGFFAWPGGRVDKSDRELPVEGLLEHAAPLVVAAARELFEETGVLKARGAERLSQVQLDEERRALLDEKRTFAEILTAHGLTLVPADFPFAGRWVTPPHLPVRFDARFFLVEAPEGQRAAVWKGELVEGEWIRPVEALKRWEEGVVMLHPPNLYGLQVMAEFVSVEHALAELCEPPHCTDFVCERIEFQRGVILYPLETPTLPPATHTNAYVLGTGDCLIVDPGSPHDEETDKLVRFMRASERDGLHPIAVVLTHHHGDHVGGARRIAEALGLPVWAHEKTADRLPVDHVARTLHDGEVIHLDGPMPMHWQVLHTPGHAQGHITLVDKRTRSAIVGDMVSGIGTIVIDPPEGDMGEYLAQLERLKKVPVSNLYPAHGPVIADGVAKLDEYLAHRAWREQKVLEALSSFGRPVLLEDLVPRAYDDVASFVLPIAERSTQAILDKLVREGKVNREGEHYAPAG